jgi:shikimate kinase
MDLRLKRAPVIWLAGFMGCGKSTTGKLLSKKLGWRFVDLDAEIERVAEKSVRVIFEEDGEEAFRELEHQQLLDQIRCSRQGGARVVALGGGAYASAHNRDAIEDCGVALWLDPPYPILWERVAGKDKRPLAKDPDAFRALYDSRRSSYALAPYRITADTSPAGIEEIFALNLF